MKLKRRYLPKKKQESVYLFTTGINGMGSLSVNFCIRILVNMTITLWLTGDQVSPHEYGWIVPDGTVRRWSELEDLISNFQNQSPTPDALNYNMLLKFSILVQKA